MADDEENDPTAPFNELEAFDSIFHALTWQQIRKRIPICARKTLQNRYFLANFVYLLYAIGILLIDYHPKLNGGLWDPVECPGKCYSPSVYSNETLQCLNLTNGTEPTDDYDYYDYEVDQGRTDRINKVYIGFAVLHLVSAWLYWWAWKDHRWNDVIMIPEYLNVIEASLYLWSAVWYSKEDGIYGEVTFQIHILEITAAFVELFASFGWIMSWYRTYTRTIGRGFTIEDPDTIAYMLTTISSFIYITYNIQVITDLPQYDTNNIYYIGDIIYSTGAFFYLWANLRDDGWLWWMPVAGQYGIAAGKIQTNKPIKAGLSHMLIGGEHPITKYCRKDRRNHIKPIQWNDKNVFQEEQRTAF